jgi:hypothetical protein
MTFKQWWEKYGSKLVTIRDLPKRRGITDTTRGGKMVTRMG